MNYDSLGRETGVSAVTAKEWVGLLEDSFLLRLVHPYHANRSKRLVKSPKLYFTDMRLAAHLAGWRDTEMLRLGPMGGAAFETHLLGEIVRWYQSPALEFELHFWRTRDGDEIDFLVESGGACKPIEVEAGSADPARLPALGKIAQPNGSRARWFRSRH